MLVILFAIVSAAPTPLEKRKISSCYKKNARLTQYWIPKEGEKDMLNNGQKVTLTGKKNKSLKTSSGKTIAKVAEVTYDKFQMEGTGLLKNGKMVNLGESSSVFMQVDRKESPYGLGSNGNALQPWVSVAANDIKRGTKLYIKEFDGLKLPDGKVHNGCVRVDDEGWSFDGCQIDFFVLQYSAYVSLKKKLPDNIHATEKNCKILNYVTKSVENWAVL
ncbi:3d domain protein [Lichtheimia corymbifera JMRC:FSU:9682]|uniref:3d domain protein n=1 Tax=Lichtheimia corymbifera JMRC:FSU:9682 TaxID=1263082 RepID=A0A068SB52_9FUNG|nr:3d domain protein [Lichtheimia corymbifera JMRC:FSU:9682]